MPDQTFSEELYDDTALKDAVDRMANLIKTHATRSYVDSAVEQKQDILTFDSTPTAGSTKPVTSGGIKAAVESVDTEIGELKENLNYTQYGYICSIGDLEENGTVVVVPHFVNNTVTTATGEVGSQNSKRCTSKELIYIPDGATMQTVVTSEIYNNAPFCFDRNKIFLGQSSRNSVLLPNTRYIRLLVSRKDNEDITPEQANAYLTLTINKVTTKSVVDNLTSNLSEIIKEETSTAGTNKFNPDKKETGFIAANTGAINPSADYFTSDFIDVSAFTEGYAFTPKARKILFYDAYKNAIPASYHINETAAGVIEIDATYKYVRMSWYRSSIDVMVADSTTLPSYVPYETIAKDGVNYLNSDTKVKIQQMVGEGGKSSQIASFLNGKTVAIFGDSIMYGAGSSGSGVGDILAQKYGMNLEKYCVSGATMGVRTDDPSYTVDEVHHIAKQVRNAIAANIAPDIIILDGGTNDIGGNITIGTMSEVYTQPSSESNFADGFETVAYLLTKNFVGVPIIYMRAHNMSSRSYQNQIDYGELGNKIAEKWGIRTVDMYKRMNTQLAEYRTVYLADYTHPNAAGYNKYYIPALEDYVFSELLN